MLIFFVVPLEFQSDAADLEFAFCLATKDPNGNATTGIERKSVSSGFTLGNDYYTSSGFSCGTLQNISIYGLELWME